MQIAARFALAMLALAACGCERGWLSTWLSARGVALGEERGGPGVELGGIDCADGLARCSAGSIFVSRLAHISGRCAGPPSACACPWEVIGSCAKPCLFDDVPFVLPPALAVRQLCTPRADETYAEPSKPIEGAEAGACDEGAMACHDGGVSLCQDQAVRQIARCLHGCAAGETTVEDVRGTEAIERAVAVLCVR